MKITSNLNKLRRLGQTAYGCTAAVSIAFALSLPQAAFGFNYLGNAIRNTNTVIVHAGGYAGTGGEVVVTVAIDATSPYAKEMEPAVKQAIEQWNSLLVTTGNFIEHNNSVLPDDATDFQSVVLHELGHALGLDHPNLDSESGFDVNERKYTSSLPGKNKKYDLNPGSDKSIGTTDDLRNDDINLNYFAKATNNPFVLASPVDKKTYTNNISSLPSGHKYSVYPNPNSSKEFGVAKTLAVMAQGAFSGATKRTLTADDVAAIKYAMSGLDEIAGTADDYQLRLVYRGRLNYDQLTAEQIQVVITFEPGFETSFANTLPLGSAIPNTNHERITRALIGFSKDINWFFSPEVSSPWQNPKNPLDVNNDSRVVPQDALIIINELNARGIRTLTGKPGVNGNPAHYYDTNGDNMLTPADVLLIINSLNRPQSSGEGEGESSAQAEPRIVNAKKALELDKKYSLSCSRALQIRNHDIKASWNKIRAKFFDGPRSARYYITSQGLVYKWNGSFERSTFLASLDNDYYQNPALLYNANDLIKAY